MDNEEFKQHIEKNFVGKLVKVRRRNGFTYNTTVEGVSDKFVFFKDGIITSLVSFNDIESIVVIAPKDHQNGEGGSQ